MINLRRGDVQCNAEGKAISITLEFTKGTARRGGTEFVRIDDDVVQTSLGELSDSRMPGVLLVPMTMAQFYSFFPVMVHTLGPTDFNIKADSVRRGGATWDFQYHNCLPRTLERGR